MIKSAGCVPDDLGQVQTETKKKEATEEKENTTSPTKNQYELEVLGLKQASIDEQVTIANSLISMENLNLQNHPQNVDKVVIESSGNTVSEKL